jgi:hypothetical protein
MADVQKFHKNTHNRASAGLCCKINIICTKVESKKSKIVFDAQDNPKHKYILLYPMQNDV